MTEYRAEGLFPFPRNRLWELLGAHRDPEQISRIHPLVRSQRTVSAESNTMVVDRTIEARGKEYASRFKMVQDPPVMTRWEVVSGDGPWANGSWLENRYRDAPGGTWVESSGDLRIQVLPFFLPQKSFIRRVLDEIDAEDVAYLRG
jgi:hypothetical protein